MNCNSLHVDGETIFNGSPLPLRKQLNFTQKDNLNSTINEKNNNLYPNCDVNVWLRSCEKEIIEPLDGKISGYIPDWLNGSLFRNGPGSLKAGNDYFKHIFDSSALIHRFNIKNGTITYQCRFVQSEVYKKNWMANRIVTTEFGTQAVPDPCHTIFEKVSAIFKNDLSDNTMISVIPLNDEIYAFGESPVIHKINPNTLSTENRLDVSKYISIVNHTSHPHILKDGTTFNLALSIQLLGPYHKIICLPSSKQLSKKITTIFEEANFVASIPSRWPLYPSYMHTFGITENYFLIVEQPLSISVTSIVKNKFNNEPTAGCFRWYQNQLTQINVISRITGCLMYKFYAETFFYLHIINQYELSDYIILDICIYRDPSMLDCMYVETMKNMQKNPDYAKMFRSRPVRFILPLKPIIINNNIIQLPNNTKAKAYYMKNNEIMVQPEILCNLGCETPRINYENNLGIKYRYFYAISSDVDNENPGTLIKVDTKTKTAKTWCENNCYPSEPIFVPSPQSMSEDDGVILSAIVWGMNDTNHVGLLILDGKDFKELGRAEFHTPGPVPKCLHGWYLPNKIN